MMRELMRRHWRACACTLTVAMVAATALTGCRIEPPLNLAGGRPIETRLPEIVTDINVIWDIDVDWKTNWWYGWDEKDIQLWGHINYPDPTYFETRLYHLGSAPGSAWRKLDRQTVWGNNFSRRYDYGYYDLLIWSNIDSPDGTQVLRIDESVADSIIATTSNDRLPYSTAALQPSRSSTYNNPEIFYGGLVDDMRVSDDPADYDYFDADREVWVKHIEAKLNPLVYTYLVQIVVYNNRGRVLGTGDRAGMTSMADAVCVHSGRTSLRDIIVTYDMRFKKGLPARGGREADILGGKLTTFGLCDMDPWQSSRSPHYTGSRGDLTNHVMVDLAFSNSSDSVYLFDVTKQMQSQAHGGVVTIEIDADTLTIPSKGSSAGGSSFDPTVADRDTIDHEFIM